TMIQAKTIEGTATSSTQIVLSNRSIPLDIDLAVPASPVTMGLVLPASGIQPSLTFQDGDQGQASVVVGDLSLHMISRLANGSIGPKPIGDFVTDCTQLPGQNTALHTSTGTDADGGDNGGGDNGGGDNGGGEPQPEIPVISVAPEAVDFGDVLAGLSAQRTITIANAG